MTTCIPLVLILIIIVFLILIITQLKKTEAFQDYQCIDQHKTKAFKSLLQYWSQFAKKHNINYSISDGTLLGYYRENGKFIGFDGDMDTMIDKEGVEKLIKLAQDSNEPNVIFTKDLKTELQKSNWKPNEIKFLVIYEDYYVDCNGNKVDKYTDSCSLGIPKWGGAELYGRLIFNNNKNRKYHLDLFSKEKYLDYFKKGTQDCILEGIDTRCFVDTDKYIRSRYGDDWNIPWKMCDGNTGKWYDNQQSPHNKKKF